MQARETLDAAMTEAQWQRVVTDLAHRTGWRVYHTYDARHSTAGFPDLVLVKPGDAATPGRLVFLELKTARGRVRPEQAAWLVALATVPGVVARVIRPGDWDDVLHLLVDGSAR